MITVTGLSMSYNGKKVVDDLSFTMKEGKLFALLGSNGAGKSTTIKMMLSLVKKDGGRIEIPSKKYCTLMTCKTQETPCSICNTEYKIMLFGNILYRSLMPTRLL